MKDELNIVRVCYKPVSHKRFVKFTCVYRFIRRKNNETRTFIAVVTKYNI